MLGVYTRKTLGKYAELINTNNVVNAKLHVDILTSDTITHKILSSI